MTKRKPRSRRPKGRRNKRIPISTKELVIQYRHCGLKLREIADKTNLGYSTVEHILNKWAPANPDRVKLARANALEALAGKVQEKAMDFLDHITEDSMTHDRVEQFDKDGKLIGVQHSGPNAVQLATAFGILADKVNLLHKTASELRGDGGAQIGPEDFKGLLDSVKGRMARLTQLNADLNTGEVQAKILEIESMIGEDGGEIEADYEVVDEDTG